MNDSPVSVLNGATERPIIHTASAPSLRLDNRRCDATKEAQELFGRTIGDCYGSFSCSHSRIRGRLYVASRALLFYSSLLGFETRISLDFHDVLEIELFRTTSISVRTFEGETYVFKSFENRETVLHLLQTHARLNTSFTVDTGSIATLNASFEKQRHRSASSFSSSNYTLYEGSSETNQSSSAQLVGNRRRCVSDSIVNDRADSREQKQAPPKLHENEKSIPPGESKHAETWGSIQNGTPLQEIAVKVSFLNDMIAFAISPHIAYKIVSFLLQSLNLPCSLEFFFQTFLADDAEHSLARYQSEHIHDRDVAISPWAICSGENEKEGSVMMSRTITFSHPIKAVAMGLGPSEARTKRHQRLWRFEKGILLENTTHIDGIPNADAFCICDRWVIAEKECVQLSSSFELQFTKRSLFRSIIEKSVKKETMDWWSGYTRMVIQEVLNQQETQVDVSSGAVETIILPQLLERLEVHLKGTKRLLLFVIFLLVCLLLLLIFQLMIFANEIRLLRATFSSVNPFCQNVSSKTYKL